MTNDFFASYSALPRNQLARAEALNAIFDAIIVGFDKFPSALALQQDRATFLVDTGAAGAYVLTPTIALAAYVAGARFSFIAVNANAGASTLNISGLGVKAIKRQDGAATAALDIPAGRIITVMYDGNDFQLMSLAGSDVTTSGTNATAAAASASAAASSAGTASTDAATATAQAVISTAQAVIATAQAGTATTGASTATTQAGNASTSATTATTQAGISTAQAVISTAQAVISTAQAVIATTKAGASSTSAAAALVSQNAAAVSAAAALVSASAVSSTVAQWCVGAGTSTAITGAFPTPVAALTDGMVLAFRALLANTTTAPTFKADGTTARTITKNGGQALGIGDITGPLHECYIRYNLANTRWELLNPRNPPGPKWAMQNTSTQSVSSGVYTKVSHDTVDLDTHGAVATSRFTCPTGHAGWYRVKFRLQGYATNMSANVTLLYKNGALSTGNMVWNSFGSFSGYDTATDIVLIYLAAGDYLEHFGRVDGTSPNFYGLVQENASFTGEWAFAG